EHAPPERRLARRGQRKGYTVRSRVARLAPAPAPTPPGRSGPHKPAGRVPPPPPDGSPARERGPPPPTSRGGKAAADQARASMSGARASAVAAAFFGDQARNGCL